MATRLTLIAHASTAASRAATFAGDEPLDERGIRDARALAETLQMPERAWTSPARQARETVAALGLLAETEPLLADASYGRWTGRSFDAVAAQEPDALAAWTIDPSAAPHGGEPVIAIIERVGRWLDARRGERGHALAVTSSTTPSSAA